MNIEAELNKLKQDVEQHLKLATEHSFLAKTKTAKIKKLEKQFEKLNDIINERLQTTIQ